MRSKHPRGWLLVEVAVGGVMASVIVGALLVNIGDANDKSTVIGRELTAVMLAQRALEQSRSTAFASLTAGTSAVSPPSGLSTDQSNRLNRYTVTRTITAGTVVNGTLTSPFRDVSVLVKFKLVDGTTKNVTMETRIYNPS